MCSNLDSISARSISKVLSSIVGFRLYLRVIELPSVDRLPVILKSLSKRLALLSFVTISFSIFCLVAMLELVFL